jgi:uncharacterized tellurite resistance protein B-like protein
MLPFDAFYYFSRIDFNPMIIHNNFEEFALFLYVHMAHTDGSLHPSEEGMILNKISKLFPEEQNARAKLDEVILKYNELEQEEVLETIRASFNYFYDVTFAQKYKVYTDMYDVINADGKVDEAEKKALDALKEIISINAELKKIA